MAELLVGLQAKATQYWEENQEGIKAKGKGAFMTAVARLQKHGHEKAVAAAALEQFQRSDPVQEGWTDDGGKIDVSRIPNVLFPEAFLTPCEAPLVASRHAQVTYCGILEKKHTELPFMPAKYYPRYLAMSVERKYIDYYGKMKETVEGHGLQWDLYVMKGRIELDEINGVQSKGLELFINTKRGRKYELLCADEKVRDGWKTAVEKVVEEGEARQGAEMAAAAAAAPVGPRAAAYAAAYKAEAESDDDPDVDYEARAAAAHAMIAAHTPKPGEKEGGHVVGEAHAARLALTKACKKVYKRAYPHMFKTAFRGKAIGKFQKYMTDPDDGFEWDGSVVTPVGSGYHAGFDFDGACLTKHGERKAWGYIFDGKEMFRWKDEPGNPNSWTWTVTSKDEANMLEDGIFHKTGCDPESSEGCGWMLSGKPGRRVIKPARGENMSGFSIQDNVPVPVWAYCIVPQLMACEEH